MGKSNIQMYFTVKEENEERRITMKRNNKDTRAENLLNHLGNAALVIGLGMIAFGFLQVLIS